MGGPGDQADRVQQRATAHRDHVRVAIDGMLEDLALHLLDEEQLVLDLLAPGHRDRRRHQRQLAGMVPEVSLDLIDQARAGTEQAIVDEHQTTMPPIRLETRRRFRQHRIGRIEQPLGEVDRVLVGDREALDVHGGLPGL